LRDDVLRSAQLSHAATKPATAAHPVAMKDGYAA